MDRNWKFPVKFAERDAFAQQHINLCFLVGTTAVKISALMSGRNRKPEASFQLKYHSQGSIKSAVYMYRGDLMLALLIPQNRNLFDLLERGV